MTLHLLRLLLTERDGGTPLTFSLNAYLGSLSRNIDVDDYKHQYYYVKAKKMLLQRLWRQTQRTRRAQLRYVSA